MAFYPNMTLVVGPTHSARLLAETLRLRPRSYRLVTSGEHVQGLVFNEVHYTHDASTNLRFYIEGRARQVAARTNDGLIKVVDHWEESVTEHWSKTGEASYEISSQFPMGKITDSMLEKQKPTKPAKSILGVVGWAMRGRRLRGV